MIFILYSADYEVFLGGNHRPEGEVMVDTTEAVLAACDQIGVPMTLFADVCCLWRYRQLGHLDFPKQVDEQMCRAVQRGHDAQVHIHPHWLETEICHEADGRSRYQFDPTRCLLSNCVDHSGGQVYDFALDLLSRAKKYLSDLLRPVAPDYQCVAFRAGGWGIQPGEKEIFAALKDAGYLIDSSVGPGMRFITDANQVDFTGVPRQGNYYLSPREGLARAADEGVFEIPILRDRMGPGSCLRGKLRAIERRLRKRPPGLSLDYAVQDTLDRPSLAHRLMQSLTRWDEMLELSDDPRTLLDITRRYVAKYGRNDGDLFFSFSCHPKNVGPPKLDALKQYHACLERSFGSSVQAITFQQAAEKILRVS